ncbi:SAM-dependent methyltransferase [Reinekea thalattae]|uniref:Class I SAM-dependent methyltransferase n=1 Tax=Reinekea thalattae TaxID=2593301 RepID=A0A5C8Z5E2_9GAMM|nr:cyclopropane-fatty-acyl-phospholipid synthase family protein [Reinekea thalattae]TXR52140.1 class I SAM-dependent methyltransferase [Reinekea thalattae]
MDQTAKLQSAKGASWLTLRCRAIVHHFFSKLEDGQLMIKEQIEDSAQQQFSFGTHSSDQEQLVASIQVYDLSMYKDFIFGGSIGAAKAFIEGKWQADDLTTVIRVFARAQKITDKLEKYYSWIGAAKNKLLHRLRANSIKGSKKNILAHYDLGDELFSQFLCDEMVYSSAVFAEPLQSLGDAQLNKFKTICDQLELTESDHVVEIGTGWGGLAIYAAQHYGCRVTTTTISDSQHAYAKKRIEALGLSDKITLLKKDYRLLTGQYDKLMSVEMIEAVGYEHLSRFFQVCNSLVKPKGKMLIQAITIADQRFEHYRNHVDFIQRYIFPGGFLPSITLLTQQLTKHTDMVTESISDIGLDYAKTLNIWQQNFNKNWSQISQHGYDQAFKNLWQFYLSYCEGAFLERATSTVHLLARKS